MKAIAFLALALLAGTLMAGTGGSVLVDGGVTYEQVPTSAVQQIATVKVQDAVVSWQPQVTYEERDVQLQVPAPIRLQSTVQTVASPSVQSVIQYAVPTVASTCTQCQVMPMTQTYSAPQTVTYQTYPTCDNGQCPPPQMPSPNRHVIEYQPAQVGVNGVPIKTHSTPLRTLHTIRKALRDAPISPSPGSQSFR